MSFPNPKRLGRQAEKLCADWNRRHPNPGVRVAVTQDDETVLETLTESQAWVLGGHTAVILVAGISGAYSLDRVEAAK